MTIEGKNAMRPNLDPIIEETIRRAMEPYIGVLPQPALAIMRETLIDALTTHPTALEALNALQERPVVDKSGTRTRSDEAEDGDRDSEEGVA